MKRNVTKFNSVSIAASIAAFFLLCSSSGLLGQAKQSSPAASSADKKPNIVFIMGDDVGMWNIGAYHRGMMAGRTPNLDKLAKEGMLFTDYYAEAS